MSAGNLNTTIYYQQQYSSCSSVTLLTDIPNSIQLITDNFLANCEHLSADSETKNDKLVCVILPKICICSIHIYYLMNLCFLLQGSGNNQSKDQHSIVCHCINWYTGFTHGFVGWTSDLGGNDVYWYVIYPLNKQGPTTELLCKQSEIHKFLIGISVVPAGNVSSWQISNHVQCILYSSAVANWYLNAKAQLAHNFR